MMPLPATGCRRQKSETRGLIAGVRVSAFSHHVFHPAPKLPHAKQEDQKSRGPDKDTKQFRRFHSVIKLGLAPFSKDKGVTNGCGPGENLPQMNTDGHRSEDTPNLPKPTCQSVTDANSLDGGKTPVCRVARPERLAGRTGHSQRELLAPAAGVRENRGPFSGGIAP